MSVVAGKRELCSSNMKYFKSVQGVANYSLIDRYPALAAIISKRIEAKYQDFLAQPDVNINEVTWFSCKYTQTPCLLKSLHDDTYQHYNAIKDETVAHYKKIISNLRASGNDLDAEYLEKAIKFIDDRFLYCFDDKVVLGVWGMQLRENIQEPYGIAVYQLYDTNYFFVKFLPGEFGTILGKDILKKEVNTRVSENEIPNVKAFDGYVFAGWSTNPVGRIVDSNLQFTAVYNIVEKPIEPIIVINHDPDTIIIDKKLEPQKFLVTFDAGDKGTIEGSRVFELMQGHIIKNDMIPVVKPKRGYVFTGWNVNPYLASVDSDVTYTAQYKRKRDWWAWLLWLLLTLLLLWLLILLLRRCDGSGCSRRGDLVFSGDTLVSGRFYDDPTPYEPTPTDPRYKDVLPPFERMMPPVDTTKIIENPEKPGEIISDGLVIINKDDSKSIIDLALAFKNVYPEYDVIYYNTDTDVMLVKVPEEKREIIKREIHNKIPNFDFYVTELSTVGLGYVPNDAAIQNPEINWYLKAVNAFEAWDITRGSEDVVVAIVDNGFCLNHPELKNRVVLPYNAFEHSGRIYPAPVDHGSHVAGTAIGEMNNSLGVSGIAPNCKFMPIKVSDANGMMHTISILEGLMFAIKHGADVVNLSLGMNGLDSIASNQPEMIQRQWQQYLFKEEEFLWNMIDDIAETKGITIVYAAGNYKALAGVDPQKRSEKVIRVSAVKKSNNPYEKASFSNYGKLSTLSAPGVDIFSCYGSDGYVIMNGTSMAAPIVTGAVALMKSVDKALTTQQIIEILQETGEQVKGDTIMGNLIKIDKALNKIKRESEQEIPSSGDVQIHLKWNNYNDLDIVCVDPNGDSVYFKNKSVRSGGVLEIDNNARQPFTKTPQENIYWPDGKAPFGKYQVILVYYKQHESSINETPYSIMVKHGDKVDNYNGYMKKNDKIKSICTFILDEN